MNTMKKTEWKLLNLQFVIAFKRLDENLKSIPQKLEKSFTGKVMMLPIPDDAPKEIPRLIINSDDNFKIEISNERISLFFENKKEDKKIRNTIKNNLKTKIKDILSELSIEIDWIGLILRNLNENNNANDNMKSLINSDSIFNLTSSDNDLLLKFHKKTKLTLKEKEYFGDINVEIGSNVRNISDDKQIGNFFMIDINTRKTTDGKYNINVLESFVDEVFSQEEKYFTNLDQSNE